MSFGAEVGGLGAGFRRGRGPGDRVFCQFSVFFVNLALPFVNLAFSFVNLALSFVNLALFGAWGQEFREVGGLGARF